MSRFSEPPRHIAKKRRLAAIKRVGKERGKC